MIYDNIKNIARYEHLLPGIAEGLRFLAEAQTDLATGRINLNGENFANVDVYTTKHVNAVGYEAHRKYIDIQFLLLGEETVFVRNLEDLECTMEYDAERDVAFYRHDDKLATTVTLGNGYFVILFPEDAHEPQHCTNNPMEVKKVVVKVAID